MATLTIDQAVKVALNGYKEDIMSRENAKGLIATAFVDKCNECNTRKDLTIALKTLEKIVEDEFCAGKEGTD